MNDRVLIRYLLAGFALLGAAAAGSAAPLRDAAGPYRLEVRVNGQTAPTFSHGGETWLLGRLGERYAIHVFNDSPRRVEAVVSVDGLDVIDGQEANPRTRRGYLVPPWGSVTIDGWRVSSSEAAAFRFARVADSYAAETGRPRNIGVIGVAVFPERHPPYRPSDIAVPREPARVGESRLDGGRRQAEPAPSTTESQRGESDAPAGTSAEAEGVRRRTRQRPGLGTEYGEAVSSPIHEVEFHRATPSRPDAVLGVRYDDRRGLLAQGIDVDGFWAQSEAGRRRSADPFPGDDRYAPPPPGWRR